METTARPNSLPYRIWTERLALRRRNPADTPLLTDTVDSSLVAIAATVPRPASIS
jgi:hypothetical protein